MQISIITEYYNSFVNNVELLITFLVKLIIHSEIDISILIFI